MNRTVERLVVSFVYVLALVLIPISYSVAQEQTDRNPVDQTNQDINQDSNLNQDNIDSDTDSDVMREKPSSSSEQTTRETYETQERTTSTTEQEFDEQADESLEGLPATAGELPLLGLIGVLLLISATGARFLARARR